MPQLLDADRLLAFTRKAGTNVGSGIAKAVYAGLEQRITRGDFDSITAPVFLDPDDPELLRERAENDAWLHGQAFIDGGGETP